MYDLEFSFVADQKFRELIERDLKELSICLENNANKCVLILSGSIIEAVLLEYFLNHDITTKTKPQILKLTLADLIDEAESCKLITTKTKNLSTVIRNYRNLIHPGYEYRTNEVCDIETAKISFSLVKIVIKEINTTYTSKYGYLASDIFKKIMNDNSAGSVFDSIQKKMGKFEIQLLFNTIVDSWVDDRDFLEFSQLSKLRVYFLKLKKIVNEEEIIKRLKFLVEEVDKGDESIVISLFELFGSDLNKLSLDDQNSILTYIFTAGGHTYRFSSNLLKFHDKNVYNQLGLYINSVEMKKKFTELCLKIIKNYDIKHKDKYLNTYRQLISNTNFDFDLSKFEQYLSEHAPDEYKIFHKDYTADDDLPF